MRSQLALWGQEDAVACDSDFKQLRRTELAYGAWVDYAQHWLSGHAQLFNQVLQATHWQTTEQRIYDRTLTTPRLVAGLADAAPIPVLDTLRAALEARYRSDFSRISFALYRDGRDSVAYHGDRIARELPNSLVATVSLGAPRRFWLRPRTGRERVQPVAFQLGWGDLLVMGGSCQRTWEHGIPKVAHAEPRIAVMFRPRLSEQ